jgi:hypothetical protein
MRRASIVAVMLSIGVLLRQGSDPSSWRLLHARWTVRPEAT